jgi:hypothetical protein
MVALGRLANLTVGVMGMRIAVVRTVTDCYPSQRGYLDPASLSQRGNALFRPLGQREDLDPLSTVDHF